LVYSSNVLEHVADLDQLELELLRVLKSGGSCIHLIPSTAWRVWTSLATIPNVAVYLYRAGALTLGFSRDECPYPARVGRAWRRFLGRIWEMMRQPRHGERGSAYSELWYFSRRWWCRHFVSSGFNVSLAAPAGIFYTGHMLLGERLALSTRKHLAAALGSACNLYILEAKEKLAADAPVQKWRADRAPCSQANRCRLF